MNKIKWYLSLPLHYKESSVRCPKCGDETIQTTDSEETTLNACTNENCPIGFFSEDKKEDICNQNK